TAKGKAQMVLGLHRLGQLVDEIRRITGCPNRAIASYVAEYERGLHEGKFEDYFGRESIAKDGCRWHGITEREGVRRHGRTSRRVAPNPVKPRRGGFAERSVGPCRVRALSQDTGRGRLRAPLHKSSASRLHDGTPIGVGFMSITINGYLRRLAS